MSIKLTFANNSPIYFIAGAGQTDNTNSTLVFPKEKGMVHNFGVGHHLNENLSVEVTVNRLGTYDLNGTEVYKVKSVGIDTVSQYSLFHSKLSVFSKIGMTRVEATDQNNKVFNANRLRAGAGFAYDLTSHLGLRGEYEESGQVRLTSDGTKRLQLNSFILSLTYGF